MAASFDRRLFDRRLFFWVAVAFIIVSFIGFARNHYLLPYIGCKGQPDRFITHVRGVVMTAWAASLFAVE